MTHHEQFEDIRIMGLDEQRSHKSDSTELYNMYLQLSSQPPVEWRRIFHDEWRGHLHSNWREARVEGGYVVIHCVPDELEKHHLSLLQTAVGKANTRYRCRLADLDRAEADERERQQAEHDEIAAIKSRLRF